jgi:hypothetical protein
MGRILRVANGMAVCTVTPGLHGITKPVLLVRMPVLVQDHTAREGDDSGDMAAAANREVFLDILPRVMAIIEFEGIDSTFGANTTLRSILNDVTHQARIEHTTSRLSHTPQLSCNHCDLFFLPSHIGGIPHHCKSGPRRLVC